MIRRDFSEEIGFVGSNACQRLEAVCRVSEMGADPGPGDQSNKGIFPKIAKKLFLEVTKPNG